MYMKAYVYIHIHTIINIYIYMYMYMYMYMYIYTCVYIHLKAATIDQGSSATTLGLQNWDLQPLTSL